MIRRSNKNLASGFSPLAAVLAVLIVGSGGFEPATGETVAVTLDGEFKDWRRLDPLIRDEKGDGSAGGIDLRRLWVADDGVRLYLRMEVGRETILQNAVSKAAGNDLRLYLDLDNRVDTGLPMSDLGVDLEVQFGERQIWLYDAAGTGRRVGVGRGGVIGLPTHSANTFEISIDLGTRSATAPTFDAAEPAQVRLVLEEATTGGDRLPDIGSLLYRWKGDAARPVRPIEISAPEKADLRLMSLNVEDSLIAKRQAVYRRLLKAIRPDVVAFQSLRDWGAEETRRFVERVLPLSGGRIWSAEQVEDCVTVSSVPIRASAAIDGNIVALLDLSGFGVSHDLVLFNAHTPCCGNDQARDRESDNLAASWRDILAGQGVIEASRQDAVVFAGDFNLVGYERQLRAIRDGRFIDPANGTNFKPGRAKGSLATTSLRHSHRRTTTTWRRKTSDFAPGRLDWMFFSSDRFKVEQSFVLDTSELPKAIRKKTGLKKRDSLKTSDHLVLVTDFSFHDR